MVDKENPAPEPGAQAPLQAAQAPQAGWLGRHWAALLLGVLAGAAGVFAWAQFAPDSRVAAVQAGLAQARAEVRAQQALADNLQGQLLMEQGTRQGLEAALKAAQAELGQAREKVAFFDQLLPAGPGGAVSVRGLDIAPRDATLFYRVLLTRQAPANGAPFKGRLLFKAKGRQDGKNVELPLVFVTDGGGSQKERAVSFEWFLRQEGYLKLPEGFVPGSLELSVYEGRALKLSHTVDLPLMP